MFQNKKLVFMFSGQGSQHINMGKKLYLADSCYREILIELDKRVYPIIGYSVLDELYEKKNEKRLENDVPFSSAALAIVQYGLALYIEKITGRPDAVIGTSLGEYISYLVCDALSVEELFSYIYPTLEEIQEQAPRGGMLTVLGNAEKDYLEKKELLHVGTIGAINYDGHFMLTGTKDEIDYLNRYYKERKILSLILPVNVCFHNKEILSKYRTIAEHNMERIEPAKPCIEFVSCFTGMKQDSITKKMLYDVLMYPIQFQKAIQNFDGDNAVFLDLGPMGTLKNFVQKNCDRNNWIAYACMQMKREKLLDFLNS